MLIVDPSSNVPQQQEILLLWLKQHLQSQNASKKSDLGMTRSEDLATATYYAMALILRASQDSERKEDTFQKSLEKMNQELSERLQEQLALIENLQELVPAFGTTLHALYTAHEVGRTVVNFCGYLSKQSKDFVENQKVGSAKITELALRMLHLVVDKCSIVKKGLDEGGWIDKVLESALPEAQDGISESVVGELRALLDENFLEEWAGDVVESWRDSVIGFSYLKAPASKS